MVKTVEERYYPVHPTTQPLSLERLNSHQRIFTDGISDANTAFKALMARIKLATQSTGSVGAGATVQISVPFPSAFDDTNYAGLASVEGTSLSVGDVLRFKDKLQVTIINLDGANPHTGTVMVMGFHL